MRRRKNSMIAKPKTPTKAPVKTAAKTTAERVAALRQRRAEQGLVRMDLYVHPDDHDAVFAYTAKLLAQRLKAAEAKK